MTKSEAECRAADDATLALAVAARDERAMEELYRRHVSPCLGLARRVLNDRTLGEEVVQEVFVRTWRDHAATGGAHETGPHQNDRSKNPEPSPT